MKFFNRLSQKSGLTLTELRVIFFLIVIFILGVILKTVGWRNEEPQRTNFDYSHLDSIFYSPKILESRIAENNLFDSNQESSDFNKSNFDIQLKKQKLSEKSINLNNASINQLAMLPGIGVKTAENIIDYRKLNGNFTQVDELLEVKGIGNSKLEKIKKYIFIQ